jgi:hypothetical protein
MAALVAANNPSSQKYHGKYRRHLCKGCKNLLRKYFKIIIV